MYALVDCNNFYASCERVFRPELEGRPDLLAAVAGFDRVEVDPRGFRSGSMNELLPDPVRYR